MSVCVSAYLHETLGQPGDPKSCRICLKFGTLVPWVNTWGCFFHFLKIFIFGATGPVGPKRSRKTVKKAMRKKPCLAYLTWEFLIYHISKARFPGHRVWGSRVKTPPCGIYYFRTWNLVNLINTSRKIDWKWSCDVRMTSWGKMTSHREKWPLLRQNELFL